MPAAQKPRPPRAAGPEAGSVEPLAGAELSADSADIMRPRPCGIEICPTGCVTGGCYVLVLGYVVNVAAPEQAPVYVTRETFTEVGYPTVEAAWCGARKIRREGVVVLLTPGGPEANVMPESIRPARALLQEDGLDAKADQ